MARLVYLLSMFLFCFLPASLHATSSLAAPGTPDSPTLVFPVDGAYIAQPTVRVIGLAPESLQEVTVEVAGGKVLGPERVAVTRGAFSLEVKLSRGVNTIRVSGSAIRVAHGPPDAAPPEGFAPYYLHSQGDDTATCDGCHVFGRRGGPSYRRINPVSTCSANGCHAGVGQGDFVHGPVAGRSCNGCHNPHGSFQANFVSRPGAALCYACHTAEEELYRTGVVHQPVGRGDCLACHDPHQSGLRFHLKGESLQQLCASCHGEERSRHQFLHGPVGTGDCVACHNPHAGKAKGLLYEEGVELCFLCHKDRQEEFQRQYVHKPAQQGCDTCHDPHGSEVRFQLRGDKIQESIGQTSPCLSCHRKLHPELAERILNSKYQHPPVRDGRCTACHTPHSTDYQKQLKAPLKDICFTCHLDLGDEVREASFKHGPVETNDCASCHRVHGSDYPKLLVNDFPAEFYTPYDTDKYRICFDCHNEQVAVEKWSKETQFRNGNRNLHFVHVNQRKGRSCKACHTVHGGSQEKHVRNEVPYGNGWSYPITYTRTDTGGSCAVGCHKPLVYDRENPVKYW